MFNLSAEELRILRKLSTPEKIQDYLDAIPINWEKKGETCYSPRRMLRERKAHCMEGALFAAAALWLHGREPLIIDLKVSRGEDDHVVALFKEDGCWGAISKTNHATVRYRDAVHRTLRELALSYFHEYFVNDTGEKVLRSFSRPMNLRRFGEGWVTAEEGLYYIAEALDESPHSLLLTKKQIRQLRLADSAERKAGGIIEWKKTDRRT